MKNIKSYVAALLAASFIIAAPLSLKAAGGMAGLPQRPAPMNFDTLNALQKVVSAYPSHFPKALVQQVNELSLGIGDMPEAEALGTMTPFLDKDFVRRAQSAHLYQDYRDLIPTVITAYRGAQGQAARYIDHASHEAVTAYLANGMEENRLDQTITELGALADLYGPRVEDRWIEAQKKADAAKRAMQLAQSGAKQLAQEAARNESGESVVRANPSELYPHMLEFKHIP